MICGKFILYLEPSTEGNRLTPLILRPAIDIFTYSLKKDFDGKVQGGAVGIALWSYV